MLRKSLPIFLISLRSKIWFSRPSFDWIDIIGNLSIWFLCNQNRRQWNIFGDSCHSCSIPSNNTALWVITSFPLIVILIWLSCKRWILFLFTLTTSRTLLVHILFPYALVMVTLKVFYSVNLGETLFKLIVILIVCEWVLLLIVVMRFIVVVAVILLVFEIANFTSSFYLIVLSFPHEAFC